MKSFLSADVKHILIDIHQNARQAANQVEGQLSYEEATESFGEILKSTLSENELESREDFCEAVEKLFPLFDSLSRIKYSEWRVEKLQRWLPDVTSLDVAEWMSTHDGGGGVDVTVHLLRITASLERGLGNVYLLRGTQCPFLLRDLLRSAELIEIFGLETMKLLRVLLGGPLSLNLRNLVWHGFVCPGEIPKMYFCSLLFLLFHISDRIDADDLLVRKRPSVTKTEEMDLLQRRFGKLNVEEDLDQVLNLFQQSPIIAPPMLPLFQSAVEFFKLNRHGDCAVVLLPQIEHLLRCLFASCNERPGRVVTAQAGEPYTTVDEAVGEWVDTGGRNRMRGRVGDHLMELLLDLFTRQPGLRLRDHLSHAEMDRSSVHCGLASLLVGLAVALSHPRVATDDLECPCGESAFHVELLSTFGAHEPLFHQLAVAKRNSILSIAILKNLKETSKEFKSCPGTPDIAGLCGLLDDMTSQYLGLLRIDDVTKSRDEDSIAGIFSQLRISTLYRNQPCDVIMRQISSKVMETSRNMEFHLEERGSLFLRKLMRSRQRRNFRRLMECLPAFRSGVKLVSSFLLTLMHNPVCLDSIPLRKLKALLKICENSATFTSIEVNKWDECIALMTNLCEVLPSVETVTGNCK